MTLPAFRSPTGPDRVSLAIELVARVVLAFTVLAYFTTLPSGAESGWRFDPVAASVGLAIYLLLQGTLFARNLAARPATWATPLALLADVLAVLGCVVSDPAALPPTLVLVMLAALNIGLRGSALAALAALGVQTGLSLGALHWREQALGVPAGDDARLLALLLSFGLFVFVALAWRRSALQAQAARFADQDPETQMLNRRGFDNAARYLVPLHQRTQLPLVIVLVSLDTKAAQPLDDRTLALAVKQVGQVVRQRARRSDVVARLSPDEFLFMLFDTPLAGGETLARAMLERFNTWTSQQAIDARMTFGLVNTPEEPVAIEQLIARARSAVQRAQQHPSAPAVVTAPSF